MKNNLYHSLKFSIIYSGFLILFIANCVSPNGNDPEKRQETEILNTQKTLIVNLLNKGLAPMALKELKKSLGEHPKDADFKNLMGLTQLALKNYPQAIEQFEKSYALEPKIATGLNLSSAYIEAEKYQEATNTLKEIKKLDEFSLYSHPERIEHNLGLIAEKKKKFALAETQYKAALAINPNFYISTIKLAQLYQQQGKLDLAKLHFMSGVKICSSCFEPVNALSSVYIQTGSINKATALLKRYLKKANVTAADQARAKQLLKSASIARPSTQTVH